MSEEWIGTLAAGIREKNREAAEEFGRAQHYAGVVAERGGEFFLAFVDCLQQGIDALRRELQGDVTAADMILERIRPDEVRIVRARFPWVDARITRTEDAVLLDYTKGAGTAGDPAQDRKSRSYTLKVDTQGRIYAEESFLADASTYSEPRELARAVMVVLFSVAEREGSGDGSGGRTAVQPG